MRSDCPWRGIEFNRYFDHLADSLRRLFQHSGVDVEPPFTLVPDEGLAIVVAVDRPFDRDGTFVFSRLRKDLFQYSFRHKNEWIDTDHLEAGFETRALGLGHR